MEKLVLKANKKIFEEGLASDVIITAGEDDVEIPCHKNVLMGNSRVLRRMLECPLEESRTGRISMDDLSVEGVKAFLRSIYYGEVIGPEESIHLAYEVLYAAHKYEVSGLEHIMNTYLIERKDADFDPSLAFKIYCFVRGVDTAQVLKNKVVRIMSRNFAVVKKLPEFQEVCKKNPDDAIELCENIAEVKPPLKRKVKQQQNQRKLRWNLHKKVEKLNRNGHRVIYKLNIVRCN